MDDLVGVRRVTDIDVDAFSRRVRPIGLDVHAASGRREDTGPWQQQARATRKARPLHAGAVAQCGLHDLLDSVSTTRWPTPAWLRGHFASSLSTPSPFVQVWYDDA